MMASAGERLELAKLCSSRNWSKAIRVLDTLLSRSFCVQDLWYPSMSFVVYVAFRKEEARKVWEEGYAKGVHESTDIKQLLELEELLVFAKGNSAVVFENDSIECFNVVSESISTQSSNIVSESDAIQSSNIFSESDAIQSSNEVLLKSETDFGAVSCDNDANGNSYAPTSISETEAVQNEDSDLNSLNIILTTDKGSDIQSKANNVSDTYIEPSNATETFGRLDEAFEISGRLLVSGNSKTRSLSLDIQLSRGISLVNEGKYGDAISLFGQVLSKNPTYTGALIGRGTAYAFKRELEAAISDFTMAIKSNSSVGEAWKRRGQARAALGEFEEAIEDLTKAFEYESNSSDILHERVKGSKLGSLFALDHVFISKEPFYRTDISFLDFSIIHIAGIICFNFKDYDAAVSDLSACVKRDRKNTSAYAYLGLAFFHIGEYCQAEEAHLKSLKLDKSFLEAWIHLAQCYQDLANPEKTLHCLEQALLVNGRFSKAYYLRGLLYHGMGQHRTAIKDLSLGLSIESSNIEILYLRASCYQAIGEYRDAVKDYDAVLDLEHDSMDKFVLQCLAFYQKEIALYTASKANNDFCQFDIDGDIDPLFKEYWCKKLHPKYVCERVFRQPTLRDSLKKGRLKKQEFTFSKQKTNLLQVADRIGQKIQYNCPGFLPNKRQYRMAGLASIEIAQKIAKAWRSLRRANKNAHFENLCSASLLSEMGAKATNAFGFDVLHLIISAESCLDLYSIVGQDFWVGSICDSTAFEGNKKGFDFGVRTPSTPARWEDYDAEMEAAWEDIFGQMQDLCTAYCGELYGSNDLTMLEKVKDAILRVTYYWYNLMPLSRGSAVIGYTVLLGLFLSTNMEVTGSIPPSVQVDWDAILSRNPQLFIDSVKTWLYPSLRFSTAWKDYPDVASTFSTTGSVIAALSNYFSS
ncbi:TPR repeat-containing thioredoxin TDX [Apostasia shenzhenica]|uniref:TPR repeat-containing thioredoxin TDX n=1 Tax=Apostasia shenzhenica TaxID=1088818 RepID=A0A2I0APF8_9ASPA|nr:TPR repeat-containing thioredoxin TDX [Apostasia shenzhenica]